MNTSSDAGTAAALQFPGNADPAQPTTADEPSFDHPQASSRLSTPRKWDLMETPLPQTSSEISAAEFISRIVESKLLAGNELQAFLRDHGPLDDSDRAGMIEALVGQGLLTEYQVCRLLAGQTFGLVLGNYRIVERIGAGGMGVVYKAEHVHMKRVVAIKVLVAHEDQNSVFLQRFYSEMQATAVLSHPNIVLAFDAGEMAVPGSKEEVLRYLVMEYVPGSDLEQYVKENGPLTIGQACEYIRQAASGLQHAHEHGLVHRDIKPSNLLLTPQNQVKILDFGLARLCRRRHTEAHTMLGSVDYMAPEQARDARSVDIRADIYGLGGTLYWLLGGQKPFPGDRPMIEELLARQRESPLPLNKLRPDVPLELEAVVYQMMALEPSDRYPTPMAVISALSAFLDTSKGGIVYGRPISRAEGLGTLARDVEASAHGELTGSKPTQRMLVISGGPKVRTACRVALETCGLECQEAKYVDEARQLLHAAPYDVLLVDVQVPDIGGLEFCTELRSEPPAPHLKIILLTPEATPEWLSSSLKAGADDCLPRTAHPQEMTTRVRSALRLKEAEERADRLAGHLLHGNQQLERMLRLRDADLYQAQDVLIFAMAKMAELRGLETGAHLLRMQGYVRVLAEEAMRLPAFAGQIDDMFVRLLERCVLLHDIGKVAIPDHILLKPGKFDPEERSVMESHTVVGADILTAVARQNGASLAFLQMATDIARHHHERYDGAGYPDGLAGEAVPLSARLVTIADVYDALRSKLVYKPGLAHLPAKRLILESNNGQFDPALLIAFRNCASNFEQIFAQTKD